MLLAAGGERLPFITSKAEGAQSIMRQICLSLAVFRVTTKSMKIQSGVSQGAF